MEASPLTARHALQRRLTYLRNWELLNVVLIPAGVALMWRSTGDAATAWRLRWIGLVFVSLLLLQGAAYWHVKLRMIRLRARAAPIWFRPVFSSLRRINPLMLLGTAAYMAVVDDTAMIDRVWGLVVLTLAYVEHVNYFDWQLMHDTDADVAYLRRYRRLRRSPLRRDLDAVREAPPDASDHR